MQLKFSVVERRLGFALPAGDASGTWIVKIATGLEDLPAVELATMAWAKATGLLVPE